jgi:hypothetical protein
LKGLTLLTAAAALTGCGSSAPATSTGTGWKPVDALAQEVLLATTGMHQITLDSSVSGFTWQYGAESPPTWQSKDMSGTGLGMATCDLNANGNLNVRVEVSDFRVWLRGAMGWALVESGMVGGGLDNEALTTSMGTADVRAGPAGAQQVKIPAHATYQFFPAGRFADPAGFTGDFVVAITARVVEDDPAGNDDRAAARYGLLAGLSWYPTMTSPGSQPDGGGMGRYILLGPEPTTVGYTNVAPAALLADPPAEQ